MEKKKAKPNIPFEKALDQLEEIARRLEEGELDLDESIVEFEKGIKLAKLCHDRLDDAEKKIEILQRKDSGPVKKRELVIDDESGESDDDEDGDIQGSLL